MRIYIIGIDGITLCREPPANTRQHRQAAVPAKGLLSIRIRCGQIQGWPVPTRSSNKSGVSSSFLPAEAERAGIGTGLLGARLGPRYDYDRFRNPRKVGGR